MNRIYDSRPVVAERVRDDVLAVAFYTGVAISAVWAYFRFSAEFDRYDTAILFGVALLVALGGRHWRALRVFALAMLALVPIAGSISAMLAEAGGAHVSVPNAQSQMLILATGMTIWISTAAFMGGWIAQSERLFFAARALTWLAIAIGLLAFLLRWKESYELGPGVGHIPVSNLYEVFLVFILLTSAMMLYLIDAFDAPGLAAFVMPVISAATGFLFWYGSARAAGSIEPLIPALQSYWMKLHVPANFVAYGAFSIAAMSSSAWLLARFPFFASRLPERVWIEEITYRAVAVGFVFFTIATILGALWAAEAWGGYWSWDPKETWALVVWLNYAAWLHMRLVKKLSGAPLAWWALGGLFVTLFAFLGVNMYLAGLHSYGAL